MKWLKNMKDRKDSRRLLEAAKCGQVDAVLSLLQHGIDVNTKDGNGFTALHWATFHRHTDIVKLLLEHGSSVNATEKWEGLTPLHLAAAKGFTNIVSLLLEYGANVNTVDKDDWTPLHMATKSNHTTVAELLLDKGSKVFVNVRESGATPLHLAVLEDHFGDHTEMVKLLLEHSPGCLYAQDWDGIYPLGWAYRLGRSKMAELLTDKEFIKSIEIKHQQRIQKLRNDIDS
jgi:ankyrin